MSDFGRIQQIIELLKTRPFATVRDLEAHLGVSAATIRRDIEKLDASGQARKVYGGIAAMEGESRSGIVNARPYGENRDLAVEAKRAIATVAAGMVDDGDSVIVHGGSTCFQLGVRLADRAIRLYTNSMPLAAYLGERGSCSLTIAGGELHREPGIIHAGIPAFYASRFFVGAQGIGPQGLLESHPLLVRAMADLSACADQIVVLADSRKFSLRARNLALPLSRIDAVVTDDGLSDADARMLEEAGVTVSIAGISGERA